MSKQPDVFLELALRALERVPRFLAARTLQEYLSDDFCQATVERQLEVAGDALGQIRKLLRSSSRESRRARWSSHFAMCLLMATPRRGDESAGTR